MWYRVKGRGDQSIVIVTAVEALAVARMAQAQWGHVKLSCAAGSLTFSELVEEARRELAARDACLNHHDEGPQD